MRTTPKDYLPQNERQWLGIVWWGLGPSSTDNTTLRMKQYLRETHSDSLRWPLGNISSPRHIFNPYIYLFSTPISKTNQPIYLKSFIALIGKDFLWRLCNTYESFMLRNKYTDTSVQKGEIPGISSYVEHTSALTHLLHKARTSHKTWHHMAWPS